MDNVYLHILFLTVTGSVRGRSCCPHLTGEDTEKTRSREENVPRQREETEAWSLSYSFKVTELIEGQEQNHQHWLKLSFSRRDAQPTESEKEIYNQVNVVLKDAEGILEDLQSYRGAGHEIREAIQHPADEKLQEKAWGAVVPLVGKLKTFYEFSQRLEAALRGLLGALTSTPYSPTQHLEREQALAKQFAEILHFTLRFDELKMTNPAIQNDFSYYRRTLSRMRINNVPAEGENEVNNELANRMSLFYAEATPMLKTLSDATTKFVSENKNLPIENTTDCLSTMASVCRVMLETPEYRSRFTNEETVSFCLRVMVGVIILYDHVHPVGAFAKTSKIDMKGCIKVLKDQPPNSVEGLLNALRYTTKHLNDETTSKQIKSMLQ
ncbi:CYFIP-related Rac1 interactor B isoform X2 [Ailuropoda melanoleuca]|uniref:CYFIP-related Rac1 interactor B isoform X2 n=1 Tax=Ailuropoda melanoleuca TaxID=9646 RepID=UPI0014942D30|nr:CYFIP-related Rac1 interactor B isoform X2 [Ailuropoda melanoleuca]